MSDADRRLERLLDLVRHSRDTQEDTDAEMPADTIIAYCEGRLDAETSRRLRLAMLRSPELFSEVISTKRLLAPDPESGAPADELLLYADGVSWLEPRAQEPLRLAAGAAVSPRATQLAEGGFVLSLIPGPGPRLDLVLERTDGSAVAGAEITLESVQVGGEVRPVGTTRTRSDGTGRLEPLAGQVPPGPGHYLRFRISGSGPAAGG
jgi:hypothetical protein